MPLDPLDMIHVEIGDRDFGRLVGENDVPREPPGRTAEIEDVAK